MSFVTQSVTLDGKEITIETGKWAKQASGSVVVRCGGTMVLVTAVASKSAREGLDFLPLTCEYQEKFYSAGKIPGNFFRRESRPSSDEVLVCRLMDRPVRPLFPKGWFNETQVIANVISFDKENPADVLAMTGASAALHLSDAPWAGPIAGVRVAHLDGKFVANPTFAQREASDFDLIVAASQDAIVMVEGEMGECSETLILDALEFAHNAARTLIKLQEDLRKKSGKEKRVVAAPAKDEALLAKVKDLAWKPIADAMAIREKHARYEGLAAVATHVLTTLCGEGGAYEGRKAEVDAAIGSVKKAYARQNTIASKKRIDGRKFDEIRDISIEVGVLPNAHGSALFTRGETQALATCTLGTKFDEQRLDTLMGDVKKRFMLHYNFPPFSTGEAKMMRSSSRREIGHGFLAERSAARVMPKFEDFPYTVRVVSEVLESNGSSSMASVCGASLAFMDAGVPSTAPVAGIAMGLMKEGDDYAILSDILGDEDHLGDMDFKVTGTTKGVTALQMDIKLKGLPREILEQALEQARKGRLHILDEMNKVIAAPRDDLSEHAPRIVTMTVKPDKIRDIIGPGGKTIRAIVEQTGAQIDVTDAGVVSIASSDAKSLKQAQDLIKGLTMEPEVGQFYNGIVKRIVEFGAFIEIMPGTDGLLHISEIAQERTRVVADVLQEGDAVVVKCINVDRDGKIRLSRKDVLSENPPTDQIHNFVA